MFEWAEFILSSETNQQRHKLAHYETSLGFVAVGIESMPLNLMKVQKGVV